MLEKVQFWPSSAVIKPIWAPPLCMGDPAFDTWDKFWNNFEMIDAFSVQHGDDDDGVHFYRYSFDDDFWACPTKDTAAAIMASPCRLTRSGITS